MRVGNFVTYCEDEPFDPHATELKILEWPALVYEIKTWDVPKEIYILGLYAFTSTGMKQFRSVPYSDVKKHGTWREMNASSQR